MKLATPNLNDANDNKHVSPFAVKKEKRRIHHEFGTKKIEESTAIQID